MFLYLYLAALPKVLRPGHIPKPITDLAEEYVHDHGATDGFLEYLALKITEQDIVEVNITIYGMHTQKILCPPEDKFHCKYMFARTH